MNDEDDDDTELGRVTDMVFVDSIDIGISDDCSCLRGDAYCRVECD